MTTKQKKYKTLQELFSSATRWIKGDLFGVKRLGPEKYKKANCAEATCFCLMGGIRKVYGTGERANEVKDKIYSVLADTIYSRITDFNDSEHTSIADIQRVVRMAGV